MTPGKARRPITSVRRVLFAAALGGVWACAPAGSGGNWTVLLPEADTSAATTLRATVAYLDLEGGRFVLQTDEGTNYDPTNLPSAFREDGRRVEAGVIARDDMASIGMVGPIVDIVRIRWIQGDDGTLNGEVAPGAANNPTGGDAADGADLWGTAWILEELGGRETVDSATATLEFPEPGRAAGNASCNQYSGPVRVTRDSVSFGPLVATRRGCAPAINDQETRFLHALERAVGYRIEDASLVIRSTGLDGPVRLLRR